MAPTVLNVGRLNDAVCLSVVGRGTMKESSTAMAFVCQSLDGGGTSAVIDLSRCDYLDSTFLGCLVTLHGRYNRGGAGRVRFVADAAKAKQLLGPLGLDRVLPLVRESATVVGTAVPLPSEPAADASALGRHVMDCHRRLAEVDGPNQAKFKMIADRMAAELGRAVPPGEDGGG